MADSVTEEEKTPPASDEPAGTPAVIEQQTVEETIVSASSSSESSEFTDVAPSVSTEMVEMPTNSGEEAIAAGGFVKPWFLKTEDIYEVVKNAASDVKVGDVVLAERAVTVVDGFAVAIAKKVLRVSETEGFSIMRQMDALMVTLLQGIDVSADVLTVKFAEAVAQLQVAVLYHAEWTSEVVKEQALQAKAAGQAMLLKMQETEQYQALKKRVEPAVTGVVQVYGTADTSVRALVNKLEQDYPEAAARIKSLLVLPHPDQLSASNIIAGVNTRVVVPVVAGSTAVYGAVAPKVQAASAAVYQTTVDRVIPAVSTAVTSTVSGATTAYTSTRDTMQNQVIPAAVAGAIAASTACVSGSTHAYVTTRDTVQNTIIPGAVAGATATYNTLQPACVSGATALYNRGTPVASALYSAALPVVAQMMERAQPYVHRAVTATIPYMHRVAEATKPVVDVATDISMPVIDKLAEAGQPLIQPALDNEYVSSAISKTVSAAHAIREYGTPVKTTEMESQSASTAATAPAPPAYTDDDAEEVAPVAEAKVEATPNTEADTGLPPTPPTASEPPAYTDNAHLTSVVPVNVSVETSAPVVVEEEKPEPEPEQESEPEPEPVLQPVIESESIPATDPVHIAAEKIVAAVTPPVEEMAAANITEEKQEQQSVSPAVSSPAVSQSEKSTSGKKGKKNRGKKN